MYVLIWCHDLHAMFIKFQGISADQYTSGPADAALATAGAPPPPPPPPPPVAPPPPPASAPAHAAGGVAAVFAELNRGEDVTKGLRKVDKSQMTHKNPALRAGGPVPISTGPSSLLIHIAAWNR